MGLKRRQVTSLRDLGNFDDNLPFLSNISMFDCFIEFTSNKSGVQGLRHFVRQQAISVASQVAEKLKVLRFQLKAKHTIHITKQRKAVKNVNHLPQMWQIHFDFRILDTQTKH